MARVLKLIVSLLLLLAVPFRPAASEETPGSDRIVVQVNDGDPKALNLALNNVQNLVAYYKDKGETVQVEVVALGPGLQMLRQDTSPVKDRIASMATANPRLQFSACGNTLANMTKQEGDTPPLLGEAKMVPSGIVRIVELQKQGWIYLRP